jgi:hypothetical protein
MSHYKIMMDKWKDWRLDPDTTFKEESSLPTKVKQVNSPKLKKAKPPTPPEGSIRTGGSEEGAIDPTPEPGSKELGSKSGYRQVQKGGRNVIKDLDKMYILKMLGHYDPKKEGKVK